MESDRAALVVLYNATGGANWTNNTNWLTDAPLSEWFGVTTQSSRVVGLRLAGNGLSGALPPALGDLAFVDLEAESAREDKVQSRRSH